MAVGTRMQQRRAPAADWATSNYVLAAGELGVTTDTGIIKIGNGTSHWNDLTPAFDSQYLPILGTAANSALLGGVSVNSLVKIADTDVNPTNNTYVKRTSDGGVRVTDATENIEAVSLQQMTASLATNKQVSIVRTVTAVTTIALTDIGKMIFVDNSSTTAQINVQIPKNATTAFPIGSWIDICASNAAGGAKIVAVPADVAIVGLYGKMNAMPGCGVVRILKIGTDQWMGMEIAKGTKLPRIKVSCTAAGQSFTSYAFVQYDTVVAADGYNPDSEWFSIPGTGLSTARRIICNKDGEYTFNANISFNGAGVMWGSVQRMTADNSSTGMESKGAQSITATGSVTVTRRAVAGQSFGVRLGATTGNTGRADAEYTAGDPVSFVITRIGD
jgi:Major tropism determinant N-terminal domain